MSPAALAAVLLGARARVTEEGEAANESSGVSRCPSGGEGEDDGKRISARMTTRRRSRKKY